MRISDWSSDVCSSDLLRLLPIAEHDALEMLGELRGSALLDGFRGAPAVDRATLAKIIAAIGNAALALGPDLVSLEINPLLAFDGGIEALDGLTVWEDRSEEHKSELQSIMRNSYAVFCLKKKK